MVAQSQLRVLDGDYEVERVLALRPGTLGPQALVRWKGYTFTGDTWEPLDHVPPAKINVLLARPKATVDITYPLWVLRNHITRFCISRKIEERVPVFRKPIRIPELAAPELAHAVLEHLRCQFSPRLKLEPEGCDRMLYVEELHHIADVVGFHMVRPDERAVGVGALRINCGSSSYEEMLLIWNLILTCERRAL